MADDTRRDWFARMLSSSLDNDVQDASALLTWATPQVLVDCLPSDQLAAVLSGALESGSMTADHVLNTVSVAGLSTSLPEPVIWNSLNGAATTAGLNGAEPATGYNKTFLTDALTSGLETQQVSAEDVLRHVTPSILTQHLPAQQSAKLLEASLAAGSMNPALVLETIPADVLAEHLPSNILWGCIAEQAGGEGETPVAFTVPSDDTDADADDASADADADAEDDAEDDGDPDTADQAGADDLDLDEGEIEELEELDEADFSSEDDHAATSRPSKIRTGKPLGKAGLGGSRFRGLKPSGS